ncbi:hypothetical protein A33O_19369 [Nitratireductor aquibiodomus RA22]|uniref:DUF2783 domain-containing protein n=2 Tax=Nitratireductor aquibiodomus TaxID=204799 RepID=A0A1H4MGI5_9HYPH|nr:DUF2783 domain-containing protein [Nitratireductor aquibiodomus]EIM72493.1 hypothetical protein A33O_19369 [Nitratireductor aquibiodomus RA22]SEB82186.1 Protein of unknown function [Nitratireductor aquibiodomus]
MDRIEIGQDRLGAAGDDFYAALMAAHEGLSFEESARLNARLVLLLANQVGDLEVIRAVLRAARGN